jgi:hypothetical protein
MAETNTALARALKLAERGLPVFPCAADKRPTCPHGFKDASNDPTVVKALWRNHPGPLIGVPTGTASGIFVLDVDSAKHESAAEWLDRQAPYLPDTRHHRTQSGGLHLLFRHRSGLRSSVSRLARGVDTRGEGGCIIWSPKTRCTSIHHASAPPNSDASPPLWSVLAGSANARTERLTGRENGGGSKDDVT